MRYPGQASTHKRHAHILDSRMASEPAQELLWTASECLGSFHQGVPGVPAGGSSAEWTQDRAMDCIGMSGVLPSGGSWGSSRRVFSRVDTRPGNGAATTLSVAVEPHAFLVAVAFRQERNAHPTGAPTTPLLL
jgi:hypothetical protein